MRRLGVWGPLAAVFTVGAFAVGCAGEEPAVAGEDEDLTSLTARQRKLTFEGMIYLEEGATDAAILEAARKQTQSAFGALLHSEIAVQSREVQAVDTASFKKRTVTVVDTDVEGDTGTPMLEVRYTYKDNAVVPVAMSRKTALPLAVLGQGTEGNMTRITSECTKDDTETRGDVRDGLLWYAFNPSKATCRRAMEREQRTIDADTGKLENERTMVPRSRVDRVYLPTTMQFARSDANAEQATYPEYDRLFSGGVDPNALVVSLIVGRLNHHPGPPEKDDGYFEWMSTLDVLFQAQPEFQLVRSEPNEDIGTVTVAGKKIEGLDFLKFIDWTVYETNWPEGVLASERKELIAKVAAKLDNHWVTFEKKVKVQIGNKPAKDLVLRFQTLFGADEDATPHKRAVKESDVVIYNGHSYIGNGPLDPDNFREGAFPSTYQLLFWDSCVSYNYYEKDYFLQKPGGSKNLDLITNGLEAPTWMSGESQGHFITRLLDGSMPSYQTLLTQVKATDSLRVVDGEIDNKYHPTRTSVRITPP